MFMHVKLCRLVSSEKLHCFCPEMVSEATSYHLNCKNFVRGACPQTPIAVACLHTTTNLTTPNLMATALLIDQDKGDFTV